MIDRQKFNDVFQYFDKDVILNIIDVFEKELPERLKQIQKNIRENDFDTLAFNAHSLKGVTGTFLASGPAGLALEMENLAIRKTGEALPEVYLELESASLELLKELTEIRKELLSKDDPI